MSAPRRAAVFTDLPMSTNDGVSASTSRILHRGQEAETAWTSNAISTPQPGSAKGGADPPRWLTLRKQPVDEPHGGNPHARRYAVRSDSTLGLSNASTIPTVWPPPRLLSSW